MQKIPAEIVKRHSWQADVYLLKKKIDLLTFLVEKNNNKERERENLSVIQIFSLHESFTGAISVSFKFHQLCSIFLHPGKQDLSCLSIYFFFAWLMNQKLRLVNKIKN